MRCAVFYVRCIVNSSFSNRGYKSFLGQKEFVQFVLCLLRSGWPFLQCWSARRMGSWSAEWLWCLLMRWSACWIPRLAVMLPFCLFRLLLLHRQDIRLRLSACCKQSLWESLPTLWLLNKLWWPYQCLIHQENTQFQHRIFSYFLI